MEGCEKLAVMQNINYAEKRLNISNALFPCWCLVLTLYFAIPRKIFDEDNYTPMSCQDESEYNDVLKEFPFDDTEIAKVLTAEFSLHYLTCILTALSVLHLTVACFCSDTA